MLALIIHYRYLILFPLAAFEGPFVSVIVGFLLHLGYVSFLPSYFILIMGDVIPDSIYFYIGKYGNHKNVVEKYSKKLKGIAANFDIIEKLWREHPRKTMFFSKLAYGLSIPFLISAGLVGMSYRTFIEYTIPATLFQYGVLMAVGYYLGKSYALAEKYIKYGGLLIGGVLVIFVIIYIISLKYARKQIIDMETETKHE